jgi:hemerythrin-like metal-binding protein
VRTAALVSNRLEFTEKCSTVAFNCGFDIVLSKPKIEIALPVGAGEPPHPRGKPVNEPRELQMTRAKDSKFDFARGPGWHASIIKEATYLNDICGLADDDKLIGRKKMPVASSTFRWTEAYCVKIALLDQQPQKLFDTVNELDRALRTGEGNSVIDPILRKLADYARVHFAEEESVMETHNFPGLSNHRIEQIEHEFFRHKIDGFLQEHKAARPGGPGLAFVFCAGMVEKAPPENRPAVLRFSKSARRRLTVLQENRLRQESNPWHSSRPVPAWRQ